MTKFEVGVTGTRNGMTDHQKNLVFSTLSRIKEYWSEPVLHHGDCVGVDVEVAQIAMDLGYTIVCHPPEKDHLRGFHKSHYFKEPFHYFKRNRNIVDASDLVLVIPRESSHQSSGGTWYTHDYAVKKNKPIYTFWPNQDD